MNSADLLQFSAVFLFENILNIYVDIGFRIRYILAAHL